MHVFDSHIHLDKVAPTSRRAGPRASSYRALIPGITPEQTLEALADPSLGTSWFAAALHPWAALEIEETATLHLRKNIEALAEDARIRAIGETGLDTLRVTTAPDRARVMDWFVWHVELAARLHLPLVIHSVRTHAEVVEVLERIRPERGGVIHAFSGSPEEAERFARIGFRVGIGAAVTRERSRRVRRVAAAIPDEQLLVETDAPYMSTGQGAGEAADILDVIDTVATLRATTPDAIAELTWANATALFGAEGESSTE
jgi:TatD DNase family protein